MELPRCRGLVSVSIHTMDVQKNSEQLTVMPNNSLLLTQSLTSPVTEDLVLMNNPKSGRLILVKAQFIGQLLQRNYFYWNRKEYAVILIICEDMHEDIPQNMVEILNYFHHILETLWQKHGFFNVFISSICSTSIIVHRRLWTYDPFYNDIVTNSWGRIVEVNVQAPVQYRRLKDLHGYKLHVGLFERTLTSPILKKAKAQINNTLSINDFSGVDGNVLRTLANYYNFTASIVPPARGNQYGDRLNNGTFVGTLGNTN